MYGLKQYPRFLVLVLLSAALLNGCASLGVTPAQTFDQKVAYAIGVHTAVLQASTNAVTAGSMSSSDAQSVLSQADNAKAILDAAIAANSAGDLTGATNKLAIASAALAALQSYLNSHGVH